jgi:hypothetical protein
MRLLLALLVASLTIATGKAAETPAATGDDGQITYPITLKSSAPITLVRHEVTFTGNTVALLNNDVSLDIKASKASPPQATVLHATAGLDGKFTFHFTPTVSGQYTVVATAPDHRGTSTIQLRVVDPTSGPDNQDLAQSISRLVKYVPQIFDEILVKFDNLPPSPAKDTLKRRMQAVIKQANDLELPANEVSNDLGLLLAAKWTIEDHPTEAYKRMQDDRDKVVRYLGEVENFETRSWDELKAIKQRALLCDDLEVVQEGINIVSNMLAFLTPTDKISVLRSYAGDFVGNAVGSATSSATGSDYAGFGAQEAVKQNGIAEAFLKKQDVLAKNASGFVGLLNDEIGLAVQVVVSESCVQFSGPVKAHMHAKFFHDGKMWWEYAFDVQGQLTLHYPKSASGGAVPLKGRLEGFANNYKVWEDSLAVMFPTLSAGTVQKHFQILPITANDNTGVLTSDAAIFNRIRSVEGSTVGALTTPSSFFFEVTGTATESQLTVKLGPARRDTNDSATIVVLHLSVLTLYPDVLVYPLPFKPVHFVFEKASPGNYTIPLKPDGQVIKGSQKFQNQRSSSNGEAEGEYTAEINVCNPGC